MTETHAEAFFFADRASAVGAVVDGLCFGPVSGGILLAGLQLLASGGVDSACEAVSPGALPQTPHYDFTNWNAFLGPAGMPREVVHRLSTAIAQVDRRLRRQHGA